VSERWRPTYVEVSIPHLIHNFKLLRSCVSKSQLYCPMVKADAYGHGDVEVAKALERLSPTHLGVALVEEGVKLRRAGIQSSILVFGYFDHDSAEAVMNYNLTPVLSDWRQLQIFERVVADGEGFAVHVKFNTGMSRLGFEPSDAQKLSQYFSKQDRFLLLGIATHLLNGEDFGVNAGRSEGQIQIFETIKAHFKGVPAHYLNSSAILTHPDTSIGARPGIALYGAMPPTHDKIRAHLLPAMSWKTSLALVRKIKSGETVSYGGTWKAKRDTILGLVPLGYADGYSRNFSNVGQMLFRGQRVPVTGIVCMDYTMLDLTDACKDGTATVSEDIVVLGRQKDESIRVEEMASMIGTISYEILTRVGPRVPRTYTH
jgi:alanine racemase